MRLSNAHLEVEIHEDRGADIRVIRRPGGPNVLAAYDWVAPLQASRSTSWGDPVDDWLSEYRGGWQELFPNAGAACRVMDIPLPFHGEISTARWQVRDLAADSVTLVTAARLPLVLERRMRLATDRPTLHIEETVHLDAEVAVPYLWGHHPAFSAAPGTRLDVPDGLRITVDAEGHDDHADLLPGATGAWPDVATKHGGMARLDHVREGPIERLAFLSGFAPGDAWAALRHGVPGQGVALAWDADTFRHAWTWWQIGGHGHPWHGRSRILAIEPHTAITEHGLAAAVKRGDAHWLRPGQTHDAWLSLSLFDADDRPVRQVARDGTISR